MCWWCWMTCALTTLPYMPATRRLVTRRGVRFTNAYSVSPVCCPSRASMLAGDYPHSTGVWGNVPPHGGWGSFRDDERDTIATRLRRSGYRTTMIGKYLPGHEEQVPRYVPPGWNRWAVPVEGEFKYGGRAVYNINGAAATTCPIPPRRGRRGSSKDIARSLPRWQKTRRYLNHNMTGPRLGTSHAMIRVEVSRLPIDLKSSEIGK